MAEGVTATFGVGDAVTVLQKTDRDGGGDGVVTAVIGTGVDTRYTVRYTGRHKNTKPVTVSGDQLQPCPALGKRKRGAAGAAHAEESPRCPLPKPRRPRPVHTPVAKTAKAASAGTAKHAAGAHLIILFTWS